MTIQIASTQPPTWQALRPLAPAPGPNPTGPAAPNLGRDGLQLTPRQRPATGALPALPEPDLEAIQLPADAPMAQAPAPGLAPAPPAEAPEGQAPDAPEGPTPSEREESHWAAVVAHELRETIISTGLRQFLKMEDRMRERAQEQK